MGRRHWELVWCLCWASIGCNGRRAIDDQAVTRVQSAIIGGDSHDATALQTLPTRPVGWIQSPVGFCTASPIKRDVILTAGHCLCQASGSPANSVTFHLNHIDPATGLMVDVGPTGTGISSRGFSWLTKVCDPRGLHEPSDSAQDVGIVLLSSALSPTEVPDLLNVYTLGDFIDQMKNSPANSFFHNPEEAVGWDGSIPNNPIKRLASLQVQELLGHATIEMTNRYSHLSPEVPRDAVRLLDGLAAMTEIEHEKPRKTQESAGRQLGDKARFSS